MACRKCGGSRDAGDTGTVAPSYNQDPTTFLTLATYPDCSEPYAGPFRSRSVLIVGRGTDTEQLFLRTRENRIEAGRAARLNNTTLDHVTASQLCGQAVEELLAS